MKKFTLNSPGLCPLLQKNARQASISSNGILNRASKCACAKRNLTYQQRTLNCEGQAQQSIVPYVIINVCWDVF